MNVSDLPDILVLIHSYADSEGEVPGPSDSPTRVMIPFSFRLGNVLCSALHLRRRRRRLEGFCSKIWHVLSMIDRQRQAFPLVPQPRTGRMWWNE